MSFLQAIMLPISSTEHMSVLEAIILAIIQGITEFLPISSTGHMVIASSLMGISEDNFTKLFEVVIQLGSIVSVVVLYWKRFFQTIDFYFKLFIAFIPSVIIGLIFSKQIDAFLENALVVGISLLIGGVFFLFVDKLFKPEEDKKSDFPNYIRSFKIGLFQCIAMIPGISRSAATIIGGLTQKLTRKAAAEFSFFLAVPTMFAATCKKLFDYYHTGISLDFYQIKLLAIGNIVAFLVAMLAIKSFITFLTKHGFVLFGYYRIIAGIIIILMILWGYQLKV
jgi:undecaprenyl-diphosphatase